MKGISDIWKCLKRRKCIGAGIRYAETSVDIMGDILEENMTAIRRECRNGWTNIFHSNTDKERHKGEYK